MDYCKPNAAARSGTAAVLVYPPRCARLFGDEGSMALQPLRNGPYALRDAMANMKLNGRAAS